MYDRFRERSTGNRHLYFRFSTEARGGGGSRKHQKSEVLMVESSTNQLKLKEEELVILIKLFID